MARSDHAHMVDDQVQIQHASLGGPLRKATVASEAVPCESTPLAGAGLEWLARSPSII
jgi:hypothetical protein